MDSPSKRRKVAEGQALASADESAQLPSRRRDGMPHSSDVRAQEGPNFSVTAEAVVPEIEKPIPLPEALLMALPDLYDTKTSAKKALRRGEIKVDGTIRKCGWQVNGGELLQRWQRVASARQLPAEEVPQHLKVQVLFESDTWAAVLKPEGVPTVVPSEPGGWTAERLLPYFLASTRAPGAIWRPKAVHRLDSPTSGILCCAKTREANKALSGSFAKRAATKRYRALLVGRLEGEGTVDTPLKDEKGYMQDAVTHYVAVQHTQSARFEWLTTVDLWPKTGRTHQLRRHMSGLGFPILGDKKYAFPDQIAEGEGLFLFSAELTIPDPDKNEPGHAEAGAGDADNEDQAHQSALRTIKAAEPEKFERIRRQEQASGSAAALLEGKEPEEDVGAATCAAETSEINKPSETAAELPSV